MQPPPPSMDLLAHKARQGYHFAKAEPADGTICMTCISHKEVAMWLVAQSLQNGLREGPVLLYPCQAAVV